MYNKLNDRIILKLEDIVGEKNFVLEESKLIDYSHDEFSLNEIHRTPEVVLKPANAIEISEIMKVASREKLPVVVRGGATGLCGGCVPFYGGIVISTERMNKVTDIDENNLMVTLQAGVTLKNFYSALKEKKLFFPPHPGEESATIGGVISTNAGGARAVKYGTIRNFLRGIEVVLADGTIIRPGGKLIKDSTGYSLLHLFTGSEGTLGIITEAVFSVLPEPEASITLLVPYTTAEDALSSVPFILKQPTRPLAIEFITKKIISIAEEYCGRHWPSINGEIFLMIIVDGNKDEIERYSEKTSEICMDHGAIDVFVADSNQKQEEILHVRSMVYEALKSATIEILDVVMPPNQMSSHIAFVDNLSLSHNVWLPTYGHAGDGNLHTHIMKQALDGKEIIDWKEKYKQLRKEIILDGISRGGKISGEHGIGLVKKEYLEMCLGVEYVNVLKKIKLAFDPLGILNPGKIFDL
ncbi:MAG: FAD-binding oxidoreductase [Candidatus Omnitrophica bacterium]|nr:FAD-binding oxidoreductase [Candidatus Omnitrophota bacterium]MCM8815905.1 FAD-binding oxidoreductase [Candidatus Omnitrophota bacterium]